jgi:hypothetical protein
MNDRDLCLIDFNDEVTVLEALIRKSTLQHCYFLNHTFPQSQSRERRAKAGLGSFAGIGDFIYFNRKAAQHFDSHLFSIYAIEPVGHRFGIHQFLLSERPLNRNDLFRQWMQKKNTTRGSFGAGGYLHFQQYNPSLSGVGYVFERHIQHTIQSTFCPKRTKRCKKGNCPFQFPFSALTVEESNSRVIRSLAH